MHFNAVVTGDDLAAALAPFQALRDLGTEVTA